MHNYSATSYTIFRYYQFTITHRTRDKVQCIRSVILLPNQIRSIIHVAKPSAHFAPLLNVAVIGETSSRLVQPVYPTFSDLLALSLPLHHPRAISVCHPLLSEQLSFLKHPSALFNADPISSDPAARCSY